MLSHTPRPLLPQQLDALRDHVGLLKKVCRQKALYCLKDVRIQAREGKGTRLWRSIT